ncbi:MAG: hypothetical protein JO366_21270 [Methylobacteriaceae bacterium]|nr:hypothetical protein [Methylobacteriaceae bacterium]MBV9247334.1 hypothetical protein [Methylobacteriaceae bacterium]
MKVYSPAQVSFSSFLGGPGAMVYVLKKNFDVLGNQKAARAILIWGSLFTISLVLISPFLPERFPTYALPLAYCFAARAIAERYQLKKEAIQSSDRFAFQSNWKVFGLSLGFFTGSLALVAAWFFGLEAIGILRV